MSKISAKIIWIQVSLSKEIAVHIVKNETMVVFLEPFK